jgi:hypothetical protein
MVFFDRVEFFLLQKVHLGWADSLDLPKHVLLAYFSHFEYFLGKFLRSTQVNFGLTDFRHELNRRLNVLS